jgi:recombination protein RecT
MDPKQQLTVKRETIDIVTAKVKEFQNKGELYFPANYSPENALKSAWLMLQEVVNMDKRPALEVCTKESIANALLSMTVQGLNPDKKQCYFIVYGSKLQMQRSYFGSIHVAKTVDENVFDVYGASIYEGDEFEYSIKHGKKTVTKHIQKFGDINKKNIIGAYATVVYVDGREEAVILTMDEIKQAWKQSKMNPVDEKGQIKPGSTHDKFTADMAEKTAINKACKYIINASDDSSLLARFAKMTDSEISQAEAEEEIDQNANKEYIDIEYAAEVEELEQEGQQAPQQELNKETAQRQANDKALGQVTMEDATAAEKPRRGF